MPLSRSFFAVAVCVAPFLVGRPVLAQQGAVHSFAAPGLPIGGVNTVRIDAGALAAGAAEKGVFVVEGFPLAGGRAVDLELERFRVAAPGMKMVVGRKGGADVALEFDPESVVLFRGSVAGDAGSHVFLALSDHGSNGYIDVAGERWWVSSRLAAGVELPAGTVSVFRASGPGGLPPNVPLCGVVGGSRPGSPLTGTIQKGLKQIEVAVETDYEYFILFNDLQAAGAYVLTVYGATSDIFRRDVDASVWLTFVRLWDTPQDLFNEPDPLGPFQDYWEANMGSVHRDDAQFFTGRRDLGAGGVAYLPGLCGSNGYSWAGYVMGFFASPDYPHVDNRDLVIPAHELGHNFGTGHTHDYGLDSCQTAFSKPQRGTIMSYCSQTVSGGEAVIDIRFDTFTAGKMRELIASVGCVVDDCNDNGIADGLDIGAGTSQDANGNDIPDECEDCNGNGVLDPADIAGGTSLDLDLDGTPDECEPDCNGNVIPDDLDIALGTSLDKHRNNIPDECETDADENAVSDYSQIMDDMALDIDRNAYLDSCQDCDNDGTPDLDELNGAWACWVAGLSAEGTVREFHNQTGVLSDVSTPNGAAVDGQDLIITPDERILVSCSTGDKVAQFARDGAFVKNFIPAGSGGLDFAAGMAIAPTGELLVCSRNTHSVLQYNLATGAFIKAFVASGSGGLTQPRGITYGPDGHLYVTSSNNSVLKYHGTTGAFIVAFVKSNQNGGLSGPRGLLFKPTDGNLLVTSFQTNSVIEYNGVTGVPIGKWNKNGNGQVLVLEGPWCIRLSPRGTVCVSRHLINELHINRTRVYEFDIKNGNFVSNYINGNDTGLKLPTGFDFMPGFKQDCNRNQVPDNCDIAKGTSKDVNANGVPDECEDVCYADCDGSGALDVDDFICFQTSFGVGGAYADCDGSGELDIDDFICYQTAYGLGCD